MTPPIRRSAKGFRSSERVPSVHSVSLSTRTATSPVILSIPTRSALRLPAIGVHSHWTRGNSLQADSRLGLRGPFDDHQHLGGLLFNDASQDVAKQVDGLVHDGYHHARGRAKVVLIGCISSGDQHLHQPHEPDQGDQHREEVEVPAILDGVPQFEGGRLPHQGVKAGRARDRGVTDEGCARPKRGPAVREHRAGWRLGVDSGLPGRGRLRVRRCAASQRHQYVKHAGGWRGPPTEGVTRVIGGLLPPFEGRFRRIVRSGIQVRSGRGARSKTRFAVRGPEYPLILWTATCEEILNGRRATPEEPDAPTRSASPIACARMARRPHDAGRVVMSAVAGLVGLTSSVLTPIGLQAQAAARPDPQAQRAAQSCGVSTELVPSCGDWWGAAVPNTGSNLSEAVADTEFETGRRLDIVHTYHRWTQDFPTPSEVALARSGHILLINWQPTDDEDKPIAWQAIADGSQDQVIADEAVRLKALGTPVMISFSTSPRPISTLKDLPHSTSRPTGGSTTWWSQQAPATWSGSGTLRGSRRATGSASIANSGQERAMSTGSPGTPTTSLPAVDGRGDRSRRW